MNNRALSHEFQLNQIHKNVTAQVEKIKRDKAQLKLEKLKMREETKIFKQK
jgi:hypothetical protein